MVMYSSNSNESSWHLYTPKARWLQKSSEAAIADVVVVPDRTEQRNEPTEALDLRICKTVESATLLSEADPDMWSGKPPAGEASAAGPVSSAASFGAGRAVRSSPYSRPSEAFEASRHCAEASSSYRSHSPSAQFCAIPSRFPQHHQRRPSPIFGHPEADYEPTWKYAGRASSDSPPEVLLDRSVDPRMPSPVADMLRPMAAAGQSRSALEQPDYVVWDPFARRHVCASSTSSRSPPASLISAQGPLSPQHSDHVIMQYPQPRPARIAVHEDLYARQQHQQQQVVLRRRSQSPEPSFLNSVLRSNLPNGNRGQAQRTPRNDAMPMMAAAAVAASAASRSRLAHPIAMTPTDLMDQRISQIAHHHAQHQDQLDYLDRRIAMADAARNQFQAMSAHRASFSPPSMFRAFPPTMAAGASAASASAASRLPYEYNNAMRSKKPQSPPSPPPPPPSELLTDLRRRLLNGSKTCGDAEELESAFEEEDELEEDALESAESPVATLLSEVARAASQVGGKGKRGRPRKHAPKIPLPPLYVFIRNLLHNRFYNPKVVSWINDSAGVFKVNNTAEFARTWGRMKSNRSEEMNYEKMSRAMRYHYGSAKQGRKGHLAMVKEKRLVYKFGELAVNWRRGEVAHVECDLHDLCKNSLCLWSKE